MSISYRSGVAGAALLAALATVGAAQDRRGIVRDSSTHEPIPGVVLLLVDSTGQTIGRNLTDGAGRYRVAFVPAIKRFRLLRIGYRPTEVDAANDSTDRVVTMAAVPTMLEQVRVRSGAKCSARPDRLAALSLLEQARAGLLATLVARESRPAEMVRLHTIAIHDESDDRVRELRVSIDSSSGALVSFEAAHSAEEFVRAGFLSSNESGAVFHAPDVETLMDDAFRDGYCFHLHDPDAKRVHEIGLGFSAADSRRGRVDISGTLWIDTVARALSEIQFAYTNLPSNVARVKPGGRISFRALQNGVVIIDRWTLRVPRRIEGTQTAFRPSQQRYGVQESGGAIASARWPDGFAWNAPLGAMHVRLIDAAGGPVVNARVELRQTPFSAVTDSAGYATIGRLVSGPYRIAAQNRSLASIGVDLAADGESFVGEADTVAIAVRLPTVREYIERRCSADGAPAQPNAWLVIGRVSRAPGQAAPGAAWSLEAYGAANRRSTLADGVTGSDGIFAYCGGGFAPGAAVGIQARATDKAPWTTDRTEISAPITVWPLQLDVGARTPNLR